MRLSEVSGLVFYLYNIVLLVGFLWLVYKFRFSKLCIGIILIFFQGMISDLFGSLGHNIYKVLILVYVLYLFLSDKKNLLSLKRYKYPAICLLLYVGYYIVNSLVIHNDRFLLVFSQISKDIIPLCFFYIFITQTKKGRLVLFDKLLGYLIVFQIFFCLAKLILIGNLNNYVEGWVGSITGFTGGAAGTTLPILGLFWYVLKTKNLLSKLGIFFLVGLLLIGFSAGKRAVWFLFPAFFVLLYLATSTSLKKQLSRLVIIIPLALVFVYLGFRLIPSLNPDKKLWGRFDLDYTINYAFFYSTGNEDLDNKPASSGRLGSIVWLIKQVETNNSELTFGKGAQYIVSPEEGTYNDSNYYMGIESKGSITGVVSEFMQRGIIGVILFVFYFVSWFCTFKFNRISLILMLFMLIDYIIYNATTVDLASLQTLSFFIIVKSSYVPEKKPNSFFN